MAVIVELVSYPIKGCAGTPLPRARIGWAGLDHDRSFMVVDEHGTFRSQRRDPRLALVRPEVAADGRRLVLRAPGMDAVEIAVDTTSAPRGVSLFRTAYEGVDQGPEAAAWLSEFLGAPSSLVRVPPGHARVTSGLTPGTSGYADSGAVHLISRPSLDVLNRRLAEAGRPAVPMERFRPNIVVDGWEEPHAEDEVRRARVGTAELGFAKLALRCVVTTVDQRTGARAGPEPLRTLASYRRVPEGQVAFGAKFAVVRPGRAALGDEVLVDVWSEGTAGLADAVR
ncbi:molybdenum cofactor sulfurase [Actinomadura sp. NBRC 104412]|uniref:MOSC domain-containing protein n=1 Tax=Actinomadura sp. NBRC 104412 TaxID=3032203 RepID=UPI0024A0D180|nr:MOSC N-terminal beta barrel domain-containing protein [Actinomadura sp. NBRC 104412]GLZ03782.1 molybdenum cofactor sulfurase [Actinomadura sp. NBRC 104412]